MKQLRFKRVVSVLLVLATLMGLFSVAAFAAPVTEAKWPDGMPLVSSKESTLAPGVTLHEIVTYSGDGQRAEIYVTETDLSVDSVEIYANYKDNDVDGGWGIQTPAEQAAAFETNHPGKQAIVAINGSYYSLTTGEPNGALVMEGVEAPNRSNDPNARPFFAILKDGTAFIGFPGEYNGMKSQIKEAVGGESWLIQDGNIRAGCEYDDYGDPNYKYPRNCIGLTADGKVITMLADGYRAPYSDGTTILEMAQIMKELGCVDAIKLDGGGSASIHAKREGSDSLELVSTPGDGGYARKVANSLVIVSTATASDTFHHAALVAEHDYVTPGSAVSITVTGVSSTGHNAELPADLVLQVKDSAMGSVVEGKYVAKEGYVGDAVVQALSGGVVVGEATIHVVIPDKIAVFGEKMVVKYGNTKGIVVEAHYGLNPVTIKPADFAFTWENDAALGTVDGFNFVASQDTSLTGPVTLTMTLVHNTELKDTLVVSLTDLPDVPVVVTDFENKVPLYVDPAISDSTEFMRGESGIVDATTGQVHSGDYAFKIGITPCASSSPFLQGFFAGRVAVGIENTTGSADLDFTKVDLTNAQKFGMWIYIPEDSVIMSGAVNFYNTVSGETNKVRLYDYGYASTEDGHRGWQYFEVDTTPYNDGNWIIESIFLTECCSRRPDQYSYQYGYAPAGHQSIDGYHEFYVDDITIEYLDIDVDRVDPDFGTMTMSYGETKNEEVKGQTITDNKVSFSVKATDESQLDANSALAYVDGNVVAVSVDASGTLSIAEQTLADGTHNITFVIADVHGNTDYITRQITIAAETEIPTVTIKSNKNNGKDNEVLLESIFWLDVEVDNIEDVESIEMVLNLDSASSWEFNGMELAYGFSAKHSVDPANNATITITKTGEVEATGHSVIAQIPVRVGGAWYAKYSSPRDKTSSIWENGAIYWLPIDVRFVCDMGRVTYADGTKTAFAMENIDCDSELTDWPYVWGGQGFTHKHTAKAIDDKAATCTESGYTGRTYCEVCKSVVDWGTVIPATDHKYELVEGKIQCTNSDTNVDPAKTCGKLFNGVNENKLYKDGVLFTGWVEDTYYYVDGVTLTGVAPVDGVYYNFGEDGKKVGKYTGLFLDVTQNKYRYALAGVLKTGWILVDTDWHYFGDDYNAISGKIDNFFDGINYEFEENGKLKTGVWLTSDKGSRYYYGPAYYKAIGTNFWNRWAFNTIDGKEYCFDTNGYRLEGIDYVIESGATDYTWYNFGEDGVAKKMSDYTGFVTVNGTIYYMENGVSTYRGLFKLDGNYYYQNSSMKIVTGEYKVTKNNDLKPQATYFFDAEGKMTCVDADKDHKCDYCGTELTKCADEDKDHKCDLCKTEVSKCADTDKDHKCDTCKAEVSKCADTDKDHKCDTCKAEVSKCADTDKDHKCDTCKAELSKCADEDKDLKCDVCGADLGGEGADQFEDLETEDWFYEAVDYIVSAGIMNGTGDGNFNPDGKTTRAMIVTTLYRLEGEPSYTVENEYTDVEEDMWYTDAVLWATENKIVNGIGGGLFDPDADVTREQIATIFKRYAEFKGMDVEADADLTEYPDHETVSSWAAEGMEWAVASGLLKGTEIGGVVSLSPNGENGEATRAQLATILYRWLTEENAG